MIPKIAYLPFSRKHDATSRKIMESFKCPTFFLSWNYPLNTAQKAGPIRFFFSVCPRWSNIRYGLKNWRITCFTLCFSVKPFLWFSRLLNTCCTFFFLLVQRHFSKNKRFQKFKKKIIPKLFGMTKNCTSITGISTIQSAPRVGACAVGPTPHYAKSDISSWPSSSEPRSESDWARLGHSWATFATNSTRTWRIWDN